MLTTDSREHVKGVNCQSRQVYPFKKHVYAYGWHTNEKVSRGHPDLNWGPLDLQSNALPLSYTPFTSHIVTNTSHLIVFYTWGTLCNRLFFLCTRQHAAQARKCKPFSCRWVWKEDKHDRSKKKAPLMASGKRSIDFNSGITHCGHKVLV